MIAREETSTPVRYGLCVSVFYFQAVTKEQKNKRKTGTGSGLPSNRSCGLKIDPTIGGPAIDLFFFLSNHCRSA